jgi:predicted amidophosphoribosyltransferase
MNFTLAHELGHIFLDHMIAGRQYKRPSLEEAENLEADEFAGRLLMPEKLLLHSNFTSEQDVSLEYLVSDQALYKRLNNLKRLDLYGAKPVSTCSVCGYSEITPMASYCSICGQELSSRNRNGIRKIEYPAPLANEKQRVALCVMCGNEEISRDANYCRICGTSLYNACVGDSGIWGCSHINAPNARHCEICGADTDYSHRSIFGSWQDERDEYIRAMTHR